MAIPEGYQFLAKLGIAYKGDYSEEATYEKLNAVYYNGSTYIALVDRPAGPPAADGANWQYMAKGFLNQVISSLTATDKNGVIGEAGETVNAQDLIDGMSDDIKDKLNNTGDSAENTITFTSGDSTSTTAWTDVEALVTGEKHSILLNKISTMIKNVRWLYKMLGSTDISSIGDGTITGAISTQNSNLIQKIEIRGKVQSDGNLSLNIGITDYDLISVVSKEDEIIMIPFRSFSANSWYAHCESPNGQTITTQPEIACDVYYHPK